MCSGRVDPFMMVEAFIAGSDGVFIGACKKGECHYASGNLHASGRVMLVKKVLEAAGIDPGRLVMRYMSAAEANKFVEYSTEFQKSMSDLGPMGGPEGITAEDIPIKLAAARAALEGKKLRWVVGKLVEFQEESNLYGENFTGHEVRRLLEEVATDEYRLREILARLAAGPRSAKELAAAMKQPARIIVRSMADLKKMGLVELDGIQNRSPRWRAVEEPELAYE
jgi:F420-non-reducing hydrogenase iron-sulfur subunit